MRHKTIISQDGTRVAITIDGSYIESMPWQAALELARAITTQAKRAEEWDRALSIAQDQALLLRAGVPIGLSGNPAIKAEAAKQAAWDRDLRRYLTGGVRSNEIVGAPVIRQTIMRTRP
jgi:hypothetical protein